MTQEKALVPRLLVNLGNSATLNVVAVVSGALLISLLAQIAIPLPFTPVPITGQTFGVALISLLWGRKRGVATMALYLGMGLAGLPVFANALGGPTYGYLLGMIVASFVMGTLADKGWTNSFGKTWLAAFIGSLCIFGFGLIVLSLFVPGRSLLMAGLIPFLPGDFVKTLLAAALASRTTKSFKK